MISHIFVGNKRTLRHLPFLGPRFFGFLALSARVAPLRVRGDRDVALLEVTTTTPATRAAWAGWNADVLTAERLLPARR